PVLVLRHMVSCCVLACGVMFGCGEPPPPQLAPPTFAPVTGQIPADTPFAVVASPLAMSETELDSALSSWADDPGLHQAFRERLQTVLGVDVFDLDSLAHTGLDLRGDFALFGVGTRPAVLLRIAD